jgi:hypothetical protein
MTPFTGPEITSSELPSLAERVSGTKREASKKNCRRFISYLSQKLLCNGREFSHIGLAPEMIMLMSTESRGLNPDLPLFN